MGNPGPPGDDIPSVAEAAEEPTSRTPTAEPQPWLRRLTEPIVLFPLVAAITLGTVWLLTLHMVRVERENARRAARATTTELLETYEAQVVRVLREIDGTLNSLHYAYGIRGKGMEALRDLEEGNLLPPTLVYTVSVADAEGNVVASTGRTGPSDVSTRPIFQQARAVDTLVVGRPERVEGVWRLTFGRRLDAPDGSFGGLALVELDASFFVSGYEARKLGERGVLAVLGSDGVFRARRTGEPVHAGGRVSYSSVVTGRALDDAESVLSTSPWDGVSRFISARQLYDYPLAVVVGLAEEEQLAGAEARAHTYVERATGGSLVLLLVIGLLGRLSWKLEKVRRRESEARAAHARRIEHLAYHDGLTGLPNRSFLVRLLEDRMRRAGRTGRKFAVLFLDVDRFKSINDSYGHAVGDQVLTFLARQLRAKIRADDVVARLGGDEFVVVMEVVEDAGVAEEAVGRFVESLRGPSALAAPPYHLSASIGVALFEGGRGDRRGEDLLRRAGLAMYRAKRVSGTSCRFFDAEADAAGLGIHQSERDLRRGMKADEFRPAYQPIISLQTGELWGLEMLARWDHPERGTLSASEFITLAEESGLILSLGRRLLDRALRDFGSWSRRNGAGGPKLLLNLSARQFDDERLPSFIRARLEAYGIPSSSLAFEVTETELMRNTGRLAGLRALGVGVLVDDFGTGYSSFGYLRELDVEGFKIDRSFIQGASRHEDDRAIAETILTLGRRLGLYVIAEGIEREEQAEVMRELGCGCGQGYFLGRPKADVGVAAEAAAASRLAAAV